jgi:N-acetylmuramoyl-L-alanine amidase
VYYNTQGKALAEAISKSNTVFKDLGVATSPYYINKFKGPAVLVEAGFISNASDRGKLQNQSGQIGKEIASGILNYLKP